MECKRVENTMTKILGSNLDSLVISTGNVLNVNKKAGQKPTEELIDCLTMTMCESGLKNERELFRTNDDLVEKMSEHERDSIKIGAKIFLNNNSVEYLNEAVIETLKVLNVECLDNLILAYHPNVKPANVMNGSVDGGPVKEDSFEWGSNCDEAIKNLKELWTHLEKFAKNKQICQIGIADLDVGSLKELHANAVIPPSVAQINLSACCVVPPPLQEFCNKNDIPLLTHSDPTEIISKDALEAELGLNGYVATWTARYQVHVKCRGLLIVKGFIVGAKRK